MMSAKIRLLKSNILKNKNTKLFCKTMSSKFFHKAKSPKITTDVTLTKSTTKFSDNNLTKTLQSSKYKDESLFMSLQEFHKNFIKHFNIIYIIFCVKYKNISYGFIFAFIFFIFIIKCKK